MIDAGDSDFSLDDAEAAKAQRIVGLSIPALRDGETVTAAEERFRKAKSASPIMFTAHEADDETRPEVFDEELHAEEWQRIMSWPKVPSVAEVEAFQAHRIAVAEYREWMRAHGEKPK